MDVHSDCASQKVATKCGPSYSLPPSVCTRLSSLVGRQGNQHYSSDKNILDISLGKLRALEDSCVHHVLSMLSAKELGRTFQRIAADLTADSTCPLLLSFTTSCALPVLIVVIQKSEAKRKTGPFEGADVRECLQGWRWSARACTCSRTTRSCGANTSSQPPRATSGGSE
eukprot:2335194-Rhodomonas_salina.1